MGRCLAGAVLLTLSSAAVADSDAPAPPAPSLLEAGVYGGGFISNYFHQFYDIEVQPNRQELERVNMELGFRFAYFLNRWLGVELEGNWVRATTKQTQDGASIYSARAHALFQHKCPCTTFSLPEQVVPFATLGLGVWRVSSGDDVLGSDTDMLLQVGGGVRFFATKSIAIRAEARFMRGPSQQAPYHLNASYGEFMVGVSFVPTFGGGTEEPEPRKVVVVAPPTVDTDSDGVVDDDDRCPSEAEDRDSYRDGDGCPDPDNDKDGIVDTGDKCPNDSEVINGVEDDDGCPDRGDALVVLSTDRLELLAPLAFSKEKLTKDSVPVLAQVAGMLRQHTQIRRLRITVHVQPTKNPDADQALSDKRGAAIKELLTEKGVEPKRLEVRGFGGSKPLVPKTAKSAAQINERIELIILERN